MAERIDISKLRLSDEEVDELIEADLAFEDSLDDSLVVEKDIYVCLNCGHLAHYHTDKVTGEILDTCRGSNGQCDCQSYSPEICN